MEYLYIVFSLKAFDDSLNVCYNDEYLLEKRRTDMVKKAPNLETAAEIRRVTRGYFGDPKGYEEILFRTRNNRYVLVQRGGSESPFQEEKITQILKADAEAWMATL